MVDFAKIQRDTKLAVSGLLAEAKLEPGKIFVIGCSTSEVAGERIGRAGSREIAQAIWDVAWPLLQQSQVYPAIQCCEHLNRALVVEKEVARDYGWEQVMARPHELAGGSLATVVFEALSEPILVERIQGHAGLDIGDTFIGMHLKPVAVPIRLMINTVGQAHLTLAKTRPKFIGGERAKY